MSCKFTGFGSFVSQHPFLQILLFCLLLFLLSSSYLFFPFKLPSSFSFFSLCRSSSHPCFFVSILFLLLLLVIFFLVLLLLSFQIPLDPSSNLSFLKLIFLSIFSFFWFVSCFASGLLFLNEKKSFCVQVKDCNKTVCFLNNPLFSKVSKVSFFCVCLFWHFWCVTLKGVSDHLENAHFDKRAIFESQAADQGES